ncbi:endonuclease VII domain-containing protein [Streptomyces sp. NBC_01716]|uniref:endonuclease VII domain-containing protein n=1 Tax=Streptomyces sp. NBC_01716 TaxID=2975917 RepID=UPI002E34E68D|nr:endonuclease VII domain-containing protein [Streptomyces sp. NBC_01716]
MLPVSAFASNKSRPDGLQTNCRECAAGYHRRRQEARGRTVRAKVPVPRGYKRCPQCGEAKAYSEWELNPTSSDGYASYCKPCRATRNRQSYFKRKYGITMAERDEMISSQMGICVICLSAPAAHVDHCHETGRVRGVLCFNCNSAIGKLGDNPDTLRRATAYLEGNAWKPTLVAPGVYQLPS